MDNEESVVSPPLSKEMSLSLLTASVRYRADRGVGMVLAFAQQPRDLHTWCGERRASKSETLLTERARRNKYRR